MPEIGGGRMCFRFVVCATVLLGIIAGFLAESTLAQAAVTRLNLLEYAGNFEDDQDLPGDDQRCHSKSSEGIANHWGPMNDTYEKAVFRPEVRRDGPFRGRGYQRIAVTAAPSNQKVINLGADVRSAESGWVPGLRLEVSIAVRSGPATRGLRWKVWCSCGSENNQVYTDVIPLQAPASTDWTVISGEVTPPADATKLKFWLHVEASEGAQGWIDFDDLRVEDLRPLPPAVDKPIKLLWMYKPLTSWVETAQRADAVGLHKYHKSGTYVALKPDFLNLHWVRVAYTDCCTNDDPYCNLGIVNLFDACSIQASHPDWILCLNGVSDSCCKGHISLDVGNPGYQEAVLAALLQHAGREHWGALMLDYFHPNRALNNVCSTPGDPKYPCNYPDDPAWHAAVSQFLQKLQPLRQRGIKLIPNMGFSSPDQAPWVPWMSLVDGAIIEWGFVMRHADGSGNCVLDYFDNPDFPADPQWWRSWRGKVRLLQNSTGSDLGDKYIMMNHRLFEDDHLPRRFALASYLCAMTDFTYFGLSTAYDCQAGSQAEPIWHDDFLVPIGNPTGPLYRLDERLVKHSDIPEAIDDTSTIAVCRDFENGLVVVNPHRQNYAYWRCTTTLVGLDGKRYSPGIHSVAPREGLILRYAARPRVEVKISAVPVLVVPGGLVTFVVTYQNVGEATAEDIVVSARVPDKWCTFHSASDGGVLIGNEVQWSVGNIPPGGKGERAFSVRTH
ncbi:MAG: hypothetical protein HRF45_10125 [Fimbriimonadia bacterium]|jgi:hypothetical protein